MANRDFPYYLWYRLRGWLMLPLAFAMVLCTWYETEPGGLILALGVPAFCAGWALRIWAQMHLHYRLKVKKKLTTTGPYAYVRNPIYIANTLILLGMCAMSELLWLGPVVLAYCALVYTFVVRFEEGRLAAKYGAPYLDYLRRVPRWLPLRRPWALLGHIDVRPFLYRSIRSELHVALLLLPLVLKELL